MTPRIWSVGDPEPLDGVVVLPASGKDGGPWTRDDTDGRWVCACTDCAGTFRRCGVWPARWPWADLVEVDGPMVEVQP